MPRFPALPAPPGNAVQLPKGAFTKALYRKWVIFTVWLDGPFITLISTIYAETDAHHPIPLSGLIQWFALVSGALQGHHDRNHGWGARS